MVELDVFNNPFCREVDLGGNIVFILLKIDGGQMNLGLMLVFGVCVTGVLMVVMQAMGMQPQGLCK